MFEVIDEDRKEDQGNMICPNCGRTILIPEHWGDPLKCDKCDGYLMPKFPKVIYT